MLTRRSRKETVVSPSEPVSSTKTKKSTPSRGRGRSKSKSIDRKIRTRSKSAKDVNITNAYVSVERLDEKSVLKKSKAEKIIKKKSVQSVDSKLKKSETPVQENNIRSSPFVDKLNNKASPSPSPVEVSSRLSFDDSDVSDSNDDKPVLRKVSSHTNFNKPTFYETFGNFVFPILLPILVILAIIAFKAKGNLLPFPRGYLRVANYYDQDVFIWTFSIVVFQFLLSLVPLGIKYDAVADYRHGGVRYYRFSGFINLIIASLIVVAMEYFECPISFILEFVTKKTVPYIVASVVCAFIITIILFIKTEYTQKKENVVKLNFAKIFFEGTSSQPTLGPVNVKLALYKYSLLMTILFNSLVIADSIKNPANIHLYVVVGLQIFYALDKLIFEFHLIQSFYLYEEKVGFWTIIQQFLQPALHFLPIQVLLSKNLPVNYIVLSISSAIFLLGYVLQRYSEFLLYQTRQTRKFISMPNSANQYVKYPNLLGTIVIHLALILPIIELNQNSLQTSWPVFLYPLFYIITLSHKCVCMKNYYESKFGSEFEHKMSAKWHLIPKIF